MKRDSGIRGVFTLIAAAYQNARWITIGAMVFYPIANFEPVVVALGLKRAIDAIIARSAGDALVGVSIVVSGVCLLFIIDQIAWRLCLRLEATVGHALERRTAELVAETPGVEHFERPEYLDRVEILREQGWRLGRHLYSLPMSWGAFLSSVATILVLASIHPLLLLLPLFALPALFTQSAADRISREAEERSAGDLRRSRYLFELSVRADAAKELRIFGLRDWVFSMHRSVWRRVRSTLAAARAKSTVLMAAGWLVFDAAFVFAVLVVLRMTIAGDASLGDLVMTLTLGVRVGGEVGSMAADLIYLQRIGRLGTHLAWLESHTTAAREEFSGATLFRGLDADGGIEFRDVSFCYPGTEVIALEQVNLRFEAGRTTALVGHNGAGKTTLIKLLCRMYEPTEGEIVVDGVRLSDIDPDSWLSAVTAAFQDFAKLEVTVGESVGVGDLEYMDDAGRVAEAIRRADASEMVSSMPGGTATQLGSGWDGGVEPSIGQWQKLAIARCAMPRDPAVFILDEPTASLDPQTEHHVFERHREIATGNKSITVLVSHRFSTVAMADTIYVLDGGRIVEVGSHQDLMKANGYYARFYRMQQNAYRHDSP